MIIVGEYICEDLKKFINHWVSSSEKKEISKRNDKSSELGRALVTQDRKVTEENLNLISDILKKAISNRKKHLPVLEEIHKKIVTEFNTAS